VIWEFDLLLFALLVAAAIVAVRVRQLVATVAVLAVYSLLVALLFANMGAIDVAYVEAVLGSALSGVLLLITTLVTGNVRTKRSRKAEWVAVPAVLALVGLMLFATADLPDRGRDDSPASIGVAADYVERSLDDTDTPNVVTSILADYRSIDTLGETTVVFTAALAVALVLTAALRRREVAP
jgi:multicomponent Na+:H+ antiporter subunit B